MKMSIFASSQIFVGRLKLQSLTSVILLSCLDDEQKNRLLLYKLPEWLHRCWARKASESYYVVSEPPASFYVMKGRYFISKNVNQFLLEDFNRLRVILTIITTVTFGFFVLFFNFNKYFTYSKTCTSSLSEQNGLSAFFEFWVFDDLKQSYIITHSDKTVHVLSKQNEP